MKRKQLKNALSGGLRIKAAAARDLLRAADIDPRRRAETSIAGGMGAPGAEATAESAAL